MIRTSLKVKVLVKSIDREATRIAGLKVTQHLGSGCSPIIMVRVRCLQCMRNKNYPAR